MLCLPLRSTHKARPFDCTVFAPLNSQWRTVCHEFLQHNPDRVITKFNFNSLFSKAWLQSVIPAIIIAGFKSCGVYPFNSSAIKVPSLQSGSSNTAVEGKPPCSNDEGSPATEISSTYNDVPVDTDAEPSDFNAEQQQLYKKRFDEGYNLYIDPDYTRWLRMYHSESYLSSCSESESVVALFQNISPEEPVAVFHHTRIIKSTISIPAETPTRDTMDLASRSSCITPEQPVPTTPDEVIIPAETPARVAMVPGSSLSCNILGNPSVPDACRTPDGGMNFASPEGPVSVVKAPVLRSGITPEQIVQRSLTNASAETPIRVPRSSNSSISQFLVCLEPPSTTERSLPCARLLTSDESL